MTNQKNYNEILLIKSQKRRQYFGLIALLITFITSLIGAILMWVTNVFDNVLFTNLAITNNSFSYNVWRKPFPKPLLNIYLFNYTNVEKFENGEDIKLHVSELGPYVYEESLERINVRFNNSIVSYQEQRTYKFLPNLSKGRKQNDRVCVPNIPMLSVAAVNKHSNLFTRLAISSLLNGLRSKPFLTLPAHRFIFGYDDDLYSLSKSVLKLQNQNPYEHFGLLVGKLGVQRDVIAIHSGYNDIDRIAFIDSFNGKANLEHWSTIECNTLRKASDGSMFSPRLIREKRPVSYYFKEICRTLPLEFEREISILNDQVPAYRYALPYNVFDTPETTPANQCYCNIDLGNCPLQGVFNTTPCSFGAPTFFSFPHFYNADPILKQGVFGLNLNHTHHKTYADVHPTLGYIMAGKTRLQLNVQVVKSFGMSQLNRYANDLMLPIFWLEVALEDRMLPKQMVEIIFTTTFTVRIVEICLKYVCLAVAVLTFLITIIYVKHQLCYLWRRNNA